MFLGLVLPIGLVYLMLKIDPRIRFSQIISDEMKIPVLAEISVLSNSIEDSKIKLNILVLSLGVGFVFVIYGYVGWLKFTGQL